jgi:hypothetical protein
MSSTQEEQNKKVVRQVFEFLQSARNRKSGEAFFT